MMKHKISKFEKKWKPIWLAVVWATAMNLAVMPVLAVESGSSDAIQGGRADAAATAASAVAGVEERVDQWFRLRLETQRERNDWETQHETMERRIEHLRHEADLRRARIAELEAKVSADSKLIAGLDQRLASEESALQEAVGALKIFDGELIEFVNQLPEPMREPLTVSGTATSAVELVARTLTLASTLHRMDQQTHAVRARLDTPAGDTMQMEILFIGLGQAFAVSRDDRLAARGVRVGDDWKWSWQPEWGPYIRQAVRVQHGDVSPRWIRLPVALSPEDTP